MATIITSECINCGACEPECPNTAIYAGGVPWEFNGAKNPALTNDIYYIVPQKCTECVGFHDHEACAAVCPVDCCVPDPNNLESEDVLMQRARELHPEKTFDADFPSRFKKDGVEAPAHSATANGAAAPAAVAAPAAHAAPPTMVASSSVAVHSAPIAGPAAMLTLPKDVGALPGPMEPKHFPGEMKQDFDTVLGMVQLETIKPTPLALQIGLRLMEPVLGAMPSRAKLTLEESVGNPAAFSNARASALNLIFNLLLYPAVFMLISVIAWHEPLFSQEARGWIALGVLIGVLEACWRLREGILHSRPASELTYRGALYGIPLAVLGPLLAHGSRLLRSGRKVGFDGYRSQFYDDKTERDRRYGMVYSVSEHDNAFTVQLEMPRVLPASSLKRLWNLPDEMPDYDYNVTIQDNVIDISASVRGEALRKLSYISTAFPADFTTRIDLPEPISAFKQRLRNKVLEIIAFKGESNPVARAA